MTDRLFKFGSLEDEIMKSMQDTLVKYQKDQMYGHEKLAKAVDHLSAAAEIFDDTGFGKEAEFITKLIEKLAHGNIGKLIEEELEEQNPINKSIEEELAKKDLSEDMEDDEEFWQKDKPYKSEVEEMMLGLHENPLAELKASLKKKVI